MALITKEQLIASSHHLVARTERGNQIIKLDPRKIPRRLRVLLLAIDGGQPVRLYTETLRGFGDVGELLVELINLGLVKIIAPPQPGQTPLHEKFSDGKSSAYTALESMLDNSRYSSEQTAEILYGKTAPGSFDELVRVARIEEPKYQPPQVPPPQPVPSTAQQVQMESVFKLLESVRGERKHLKHQLAKMQRVKEAAIRINRENRRLQRTVYALCVICVILAVWLGIALFFKR
jgi:hypothetical protein